MQRWEANVALNKPVFAFDASLLRLYDVWVKTANTILMFVLRTKSGIICNLRSTPLFRW